MVRIGTETGGFAVCRVMVCAQRIRGRKGARCECACAWCACVYACVHLVTGVSMHAAYEDIVLAPTHTQHTHTTIATCALFYLFPPIMPTRACLAHPPLSTSSFSTVLIFTYTAHPCRSPLALIYSTSLSTDKAVDMDELLRAQEGEGGVDLVPAPAVAAADLVVAAHEVLDTLYERGALIPSRGYASRVLIRSRRPCGLQAAHARSS